MADSVSRFVVSRCLVDQSRQIHIYYPRDRNRIDRSDNDSTTHNHRFDGQVTPRLSRSVERFASSVVQAAAFHEFSIGIQRVSLVDETHHETRLSSLLCHIQDRFAVQSARQVMRFSRTA
jgi:hypothetical protein